MKRNPFLANVTYWLWRISLCYRDRSRLFETL